MPAPPMTPASASIRIPPLDRIGGRMTGTRASPGARGASGASARNPQRRGCPSRDGAIPQPQQGAAMRRVLLAFGLLRAATSAMAAGVDLSWSTPGGRLTCYPRIRGRSPRSRAIETRARTSPCCPSCSMLDFVGLNALIELHTSGDPLVPEWWQYVNAGSCRQSAPTTDGDFSGALGTNCEAIPGGALQPYLTSTSVPPVPNSSPRYA